MGHIVTLSIYDLGQIWVDWIRVKWWKGRKGKAASLVRLPFVPFLLCLSNVVSFKNNNYFFPGIISHDVYAFKCPLRFSISSSRSHAVLFSMPLKIMCSRKGTVPSVSSILNLDLASIQTQNRGGFRGKVRLYSHSKSIGKG